MALVSREKRLAAELGLESAELRLDGDGDSDSDSFPEGRAVDPRLRPSAPGGAGARAASAIAPSVSRPLTASSFMGVTSGAVPFSRQTGGFGHSNGRSGKGDGVDDDGGGGGSGGGSAGGGGGDGPSAKALSELVDTVQRLEGELAAASTRADGLASQGRTQFALMRKVLLTRMKEKDRLLAVAIKELGPAAAEGSGLARDAKKEAVATDQAERGSGGAPSAAGSAGSGGGNIEDALDATPDALRAELLNVRVLLAARTAAERVTRHKARAARAFFQEAQVALAPGAGAGLPDVAAAFSRHQRAHAAAQSASSEALSDSDYAPPAAGGERRAPLAAAAGSKARVSGGGDFANAAALAEARHLLSVEAQRTSAAQAALAKAQGEATRLREESAGLREKQAASKALAAEAQRAAEDSAARLRLAGDEREARERELARLAAELADARGALDAARSAANAAASAEARALATTLVNERDAARADASAAREEMTRLAASVADAEARAAGAAAETADLLAGAAASREASTEERAALAAAEERATAAEVRAAAAEAAAAESRAAADAALAASRTAAEASASTVTADAEAAVARADAAEARVAELEGALADAKAKAKADKEKLKAAATRQFEDLKGKALDEINATKTEAAAAVAAAEERVAAATAASEELQSALSVARSSAGTFPSRLKEATRASAALRGVHTSLAVAAKKELSAMRAYLASASLEAAKVFARSRDAQAGLWARYKKELAERRRLFNLVQELRGNIRVYCRVRPIIPMEMEAGNVMAAGFPAEGEITMTNSKRVTKSWEFDVVFPPSTTNEAVFKEVEGLSTSAMDGYNVCIFAYGQTGSGKTFTMEGSEATPGINYRALDQLFRVREDRMGDGMTFEISVAMLEIYNEDIRDMLAERGPDGLPVSQGKLKVHEGTHGMVVPGLTLAAVSSRDEVLGIMRQGYKSRKTFATNMNEHSSRSHALLSVYIKGHSSVTGATTMGKLHLIDLAGSERLSRTHAQGDRLKEAQAINKSLSALGDVIQARMEKQKHVPFRNSTLTFLLTDSLSGDSKTLMFVNLSPVASSADESICSLNFAARVRATELGKASKHVTQGAAAAAGPTSPLDGPQF